MPPSAFQYVDRRILYRDGVTVVRQRLARTGCTLAAVVVVAAFGVSAAGARPGAVMGGSTAARSLDEPATIPMGDRKTPPSWTAIEKVSNGCGGGAAIGLQNWVGDTATYASGNPFQRAFKVDFREACNLHDAAYSGAYVWDSIRGEFKDFRATSQEKADHDMQADMNRAC